MSFGDRLVHSLTVVRTPLDPDAVGEYGQPDELSQVRIPVRGLIEPKTAREQADYRGAGAQVSTDTIYLQPMPLYGSDKIEDAAGRPYDVTGIRSFDFGSSPHLEVDARLVAGSLEPEGS